MAEDPIPNKKRQDRVLDVSHLENMPVHRQALPAFVANTRRSIG